MASMISMDGKGCWRGRVDDWRGNYRSRGVAVAGRSRCLSPLQVSRFQSPLVEPDVQISRIKCCAQHLMRNVASTKMGRRRVNVFTDAGLRTRVATY